MKYFIGQPVKMRTTIFSQIPYGSKGSVHSVEPLEVLFNCINLIVPVEEKEIEPQ
jgi:hypothetical protein|tara:strand:+ start:2521 stop:2685 length:165 start_codon:yes stop_codon:yes gene_type:complete